MSSRDFLFFLTKLFILISLLSAYHSPMRTIAVLIMATMIVIVPHVTRRLTTNHLKFQAMTLYNQESRRESA